MKRLWIFLATFACLQVSLGSVPQQVNYQGQLTGSSGTPLDTTVAMTFKLYTDSTAGSLLFTESRPSVSVAKGLFNVQLGQLSSLTDAILNQTQLWLGIQVGADAEMTPRTRIVSVGYAYRVGTVDGASGGTVTSDVIIHNRLNAGLGNSNEGSFAQVAGQNNHVRGDYSVVSGGGGTSLSDSNSITGRYSVIGGGAHNFIPGWYASIAGGQNNTAPANYATISGGSSNSAATSWSTVAGGLSNTASGNNAVISGGTVNTAAGAVSVIGGGDHNYTSGIGYATVCGGQSDSATGGWATVSGGFTNIAAGGDATVSGGGSNIASGYAGTVSGGNSNIASNTWSTVSGGVDNTSSGILAFAGGGGWNGARGTGAVVAGGGTNAAPDSNSAIGAGSTVGGGIRNFAALDYATVAGGDSNVARGYAAGIGGGGFNTVADSFSAVSGGYGNSISGTYAAVGGGRSNSALGIYSTVPGGFSNSAGQYGFAAGRNAVASTGSFVWGSSSTGSPTSSSGNYRVVFRCEGGAIFYTASSGTTVGVGVAPGSGTWVSLSDSTTKRNRRDVDTKAILEKVSRLPIQQWSYKTQDPSVEHIGPMAQDFWKEFHVGDDSLTISTIDPSGIALAAIQEQQREISKLETKNSKLEERIARLESLIQTVPAEHKQTLNSR